MRFKFCLLIFALTPLFAISQTKLSAGLYYMLYITSREDKQFIIQSFEGISLGYNVSNKVSIYTGLNFTQVKGKYFQSFEFSCCDFYKSNYYFLEFPLLLNYNYIIKKNFFLFIGTGFSTVYSFRSKHFWKHDGVEYISTRNYFYFSDIYLNAIPGVTYSFSKHIKLTLEPTYRLKLRDLRYYYAQFGTGIKLNYCFLE